MNSRCFVVRSAQRYSSLSFYLRFTSSTRARGNGLRAQLRLCCIGFESDPHLGVASRRVSSSGGSAAGDRGCSAHSPRRTRVLSSQGAALHTRVWGPEAGAAGRERRGGGDIARGRNSRTQLTPPVTARTGVARDGRRSATEAGGAAACGQQPLARSKRNSAGPRDVSSAAAHTPRAAATVALSQQSRSRRSALRARVTARETQREEEARQPAGGSSPTAA
jgi:hypothetical protein